MIMLAVETEPSFEWVSDFYRATERNERLHHIDDEWLSFDHKLTNLGNNFINAEDYMLEDAARHL
jgi:hypothetical protein